MVSRNWSVDNVGYKRYSWLAPYFKEILLPLITTFYYNLLLNDTFYIQRWYHVWIYGMLNKWNKMKYMKFCNSSCNRNYVHISSFGLLQFRGLLSCFWILFTGPSNITHQLMARILLWLVFTVAYLGTVLLCTGFLCSVLCLTW